MSSFETLGVHSDIIRAIEEMGWLLPRDVQDEAIPHILNGADVLIAAETGSGKTGAIALPVIQLIHERLTRTAQIEQLIETEGPIRECVVSPIDKDEEVALSEDRLLCQSRDLKRWFGARATMGVSCQNFARHIHDTKITGLYFEVTMTDDGLSRVGIAQSDASHEIGRDNKSWGYGGTGMVSHAGQFTKFDLGGYQNGDVIGVYVDFRNHSLKFAKNGSEPMTYVDNLPQKPFLFPACTLKNAEVRFNFNGPFKHNPGSQYLAWGKMNWDATNLNPHLQRQEQKSASEHKDAIRTPSCIVMEPTRELAVQIYEEMKKFTKYLTGVPLKIALCVPQHREAVSREALIAEGADIVVVTPGMAQSLSSSNALKMSDVSYLIFDEADAIVEDNDRIVRQLVQSCRKKPQVVICSATLYSEKIGNVAGAICKYPQYVDLKGRNFVPENVDHVVFSVNAAADLSWLPQGVQPSNDLIEEHLRARNVAPGDKQVIYTGFMPSRPDQAWMKKYLDGVHDILGTAKKGTIADKRDALSLGTKILKLQALVNIIDTLEPAQAMIFCRTRLDCDNLKKFLDDYAASKGVSTAGPTTAETKSADGAEKKSLGYSCVVLHGKQDDRDREYQTFKQGRARFLICTDVAARGLDVNSLPLVVNMTLPASPETYIHRVGRTGRAGAPGMAVSIVDDSYEERVWYHTCKNPNNCTNMEMKERGGCNTWIAESILLSDIEGSLSSIRIPRVNLQTIKEGSTRIRVIAAGSRPSVARHTLESIQHVAIVQPQSRYLAQLESRAQKTYLHHKKQAHMWAQKLHAVRMSATAASGASDE